MMNIDMACEAFRKILEEQQEMVLLLAAVTMDRALPESTRRWFPCTWVSVVLSPRALLVSM